MPFKVFFSLFSLPSLLILIGFTFLGIFFNCANSSKSKENKSTVSSSEEEDLPLIVFLGDSLTEGYRVGIEENYPTLVGKKLAQEGIKLKVVNGGLSGDTSAGGLERLDWFLKLKPHYLFLALGANDGLRGLQLEETYNNLSTIIEKSQTQGVEVFLTGLKLPPNYGKEYTQKFEEVFIRLSETYSLPIYPFLLEGVAGENQFNLDDGIHPNPKGYEIISDGIAVFLSQTILQKNNLKVK